HHLNRAALIVPAADEPLFLERREMLVHRGKRSQLQRMCDFFKTRRIAVLVQEGNQVVQYFFLPFRQCHRKPPAFPCNFHSSICNVGESKAKVNSTLGHCTWKKSDSIRSRLEVLIFAQKPGTSERPSPISLEKSPRLFVSLAKSPRLPIQYHQYPARFV